MRVDSRSAVKENPAGIQKSEPQSALVMSGIEVHPNGRKSPFSIKCLTVRPKDQSSLSGKFPIGLTTKRLMHQMAAMISVSTIARRPGIEEVPFEFM